MSIIETEEEFVKQVYADLQNKRKEYPNMGDLPISFYDYYKEFLSTFKDKGLSQEMMVTLLTILYKKNPDIAEYVHEILDMIMGYCIQKYRVFE